MIRRLLLALLAAVLIPHIARADCSSTTTNLGLAPCTAGTSRAAAELAWINNFHLLDLGFTSPLSITGAGSASPTVSLGLVPLSKGGIHLDLSSITKGGSLYADANGSIAVLSPNASTTRKFRLQVGNGSSVTTDGWAQITEPDLPATRITALSQIDPAICASGEFLKENGGTTWGCTSVAPSALTDVWSCTTGNCNAITAASGDSLDASSADSTIPWKSGTSAPGTCSVGMSFFDTDATAGQNLYGCTATNTWTLEGGGSGGTPGGVDTDFQRNNASAFAGATGLKFLNGSSQGQIKHTPTNNPFTAVTGPPFYFVGTGSNTSGDVIAWQQDLHVANLSSSGAYAQYIQMDKTSGSSTGPTVGVAAYNTAASAATGDMFGSGVPHGAVGYFAQVNPTSSPAYGFQANMSSGTNAQLQAVIGGKVTGSNTGQHFGALLRVTGSTQATNFKNVGGYFSLASSIATGINASSPLVLDNGSGSDPIALFLDNGSEVARIADGGAWTGPIDGSAATSTIPNKTGTSPPGTCSVGMTFFDTDATAGQNLYACTSSNTWTLEGDGSGGGSGDITDVWGCTSGNCNALVAAGGDTLNATSADSTAPNKSGTSPPGTCSVGDTFFDTDATAGNNIYGCTATNTWTLEGDGGGGGGITGTLTSGRIPIASGASTLADTANFTFDTTNFRLRLQNLTTASDNSLNMIQASGTLPTSPSAAVEGASFQITSAGSASQDQYALHSRLLAGYTGSSRTRAGWFPNLAVGTGNTLNLNASATPIGNIGAVGQQFASTVGLDIGVDGESGGGGTGTKIGAYGKSADSTSPTDGVHIGVLGNAASSTEATDLKNVAILGTLNSTLPTGQNGSFAGYFDGGTLPDASSNALYVKATLASTNSQGAYMAFTTAGSSGSPVGMNVDLNAGYTGSSTTIGLDFTSGVAGTGATLNMGTTTGAVANIGIRSGVRPASGAGIEIGGQFEARNSTTTNIGVSGYAAGAVAGNNIGVLGVGANSTEGTDLKNVAGYFSLHTALVTGSNTSVALIADGAGSDIFRGYNAASLKYSIDLNGAYQPMQTTVGGLPTCNSGKKGYHADVSDAVACTFLTAPSGSGSAFCPVVCDGTSWVAG